MLASRELEREMLRCVTDEYVELLRNIRAHIKDAPMVFRVSPEVYEHEVCICRTHIPYFSQSVDYFLGEIENNPSDIEVTRVRFHGYLQDLSGDCICEQVQLCFGRVETVTITPESVRDYAGAQLIDYPIEITYMPVKLR